MLFLIVARFADVDFFVGREIPWSSAVVTGEEHDETSVDNFINGMITVLSCLDDLVLVKVTIETVHGLFWPVVPTCIHPFAAFLILPGSVNLRHNWFREVVRVLDVNPVSDLPQLAVV